MCIFLHKHAGISHSSRFLNEEKCNGLWTKISISELKTPISEGKKQKNTQNRKYADMVPIQKQKKKAKSHEFKETELPEVEVPSPRRVQIS